MYFGRFKSSHISDDYECVSVTTYFTSNMMFATLWHLVFFTAKWASKCEQPAGLASILISFHKNISFFLSHDWLYSHLWYLPILRTNIDHIWYKDSGLYLCPWEYAEKASDLWLIKFSLFFADSIKYNNNNPTNLWCHFYHETYQVTIFNCYILNI